LAGAAVLTFVAFFAGPLGAGAADLPGNFLPGAARDTGLAFDPVPALADFVAAGFVVGAFAATLFRALVAVVAALVALLDAPLRAARARSAMASPTCKMGARRGAAHSRGWQEYGKYGPATNMPHEIAIIRRAQTPSYD
jgi:hypothetical protein